jgi:hypothetical protein
VLVVENQDPGQSGYWVQLLQPSHEELSGGLLGSELNLFLPSVIPEVGFLLYMLLKRINTFENMTS